MLIWRSGLVVSGCCSDGAVGRAGLDGAYFGWQELLVAWTEPIEELIDDGGGAILALGALE